MKTSLLEMIRKTVAKSNSKEKARKHYHIRLIFDQNKHQLGLFITSSLLFILFLKKATKTPLCSQAQMCILCFENFVERQDVVILFFIGGLGSMG